MLWATGADTEKNIVRRAIAGAILFRISISTRIAKIP